MGGTPLFPDLGKHCSQESCNQLDFLPFHCDGCDKFFCAEHRSYRDHKCPNANMRDRVVQICPVCSSSVFQVFNEDPSLTLRTHAESGNCNPNNKIKKPPSCPVKRCKETLTFANSNVCKSCGVKTCLKHRFPSDHACSSSSGATNGNHANTKFLAAFARRQGTQCEISANATSSSKHGKPSGLRVIKVS
jgi:predicted nucleic acid binding AN1-type Zn finger protein